MHSATTTSNTSSRLVGEVEEALSFKRNERNALHPTY
jgi:hypothetical protein